MEQNGTTSPTQWEKVPFWEPESCAASVSPSTQTTTCIWRPAVAACAVGIIPRREERALVVWLWCWAWGDGAAAAAVKEICFGCLPRLPPSNSVTIRGWTSECSFQWIIFHSDPFFFFLVYLWATQYPLFTVLQCQTPQAVCVIGVYSLKMKSVGQWEPEMLFWKQREACLKEKGMLPHLFFRFTLPLLKKNKQQPPFLTFFLFQYFLGVCIYNIFLKG